VAVSSNDPQFVALRPHEGHRPQTPPLGHPKAQTWWTPLAIQAVLGRLWPPAGAYAVDADTVLRVLHRHVPRERGDRTLARRVGAHLGSNMSPDRRPSEGASKIEIQLQITDHFYFFDVFSLG
jgi:hypothetical protein